MHSFYATPHIHSKRAFWILFQQLKSSAFCRNWTAAWVSSEGHRRLNSWKYTWVRSSTSFHRFHIKSGLSSLWFQWDHCTHACHSGVSVIASLSVWAWTNYVHWLLRLLLSLEFYQYWENIDNLIMNHYHLGKMRERLKVNIWQMELNIFSYHTL